MRRYKKSYLRSFANGVLLAGLPVAAFFGADYLLAPPAPGSTAAIASSSHSDGTHAIDASSRQLASSVTSRAGSPQVNSPPVQPAVSAKSTEPAVRQVVAQGSPASGQVKGGLVAAIQQELVRVGCYAGEPDGAWNDRTQVAMQAFNTSVRVNLPTGSPDYILLTLLQGHSAKACSRSCETDARRPGSCVDKSIEARTISPPNTAPAGQATASSVAPAAWTSTVVVAAPGKVTTEMLAPGPATRTTATASAAITVATKMGSSEPLAAQSDAGTAGALPVPALDGRMAIGVLPPPAREKGATPAVARPRIDTPKPQRVQATAPARSPRATFSDLARNAP